jgi:hypothetical protein
MLPSHEVLDVTQSDCCGISRTSDGHGCFHIDLYPYPTQTRILSMGKGISKVRVGVCTGLWGSETHSGWMQGSSILYNVEVDYEL